ncbi:MAG: hypothetical protein MUE30_04275 [Spirosomaceae bacterium]|nr:hypothetical protein [Spirosomataceae bacterium]
MNRYLSIENRLSHWLNQQKLWTIWVVLFALLSVLLLPLTHPALWRFPASLSKAIQDAGSYYWHTIVYQAQHPFDKAYFETMEPQWHEAKMVFRLILPILYKIFGSQSMVIVAQIAAGIGFLYLSAKITLEATASRLIALYVLLGLVGIYVGSAFVFDIVGCGDAFGYLALAGAVYFYRQPVWLFLFLQMGYWTDERALICSPLVGIYWWIHHQKSIKLPVPLPIRTPLLVLGASWLLYLGARWGISMHYGLLTPTKSADFNYLLQTPVLSLFFKTARSFESFWVLIIALFYVLWSQKRFMELFFIGGSFLVSYLVAIMVADTSRSLGYAFVVIFMALSVLKDHLQNPRWRWWLLVGMLLNILVPTRYLFYDA